MDANKGQRANISQTDAADEKQARYAEEHNQCAMCETELEIVHEIRAFEGALTEEAHCPHCGVRVRAIQHRLH